MPRHILGFTIVNQQVVRVELDPNRGGATFITPGIPQGGIPLFGGYFLSILIGSGLTACGFNTLASKFASIVSNSPIDPGGKCSDNLDESVRRSKLVDPSLVPGGFYLNIAHSCNLGPHGMSQNFNNSRSNIKTMVDWAMVYRPCRGTSFLYPLYRGWVFHLLLHLPVLIDVTNISHESFLHVCNFSLEGKAALISLFIDCRIFDTAVRLDLSGMRQS